MLYSRQMLRTYLRNSQFQKLISLYQELTHLLEFQGLVQYLWRWTFLNNLQNENAGRAFTHTVANVMTTTVVVETLTVGTAVVAEAVGMTTVAAAVVSNPIGWAIGVGILAGVVANVAYENNFLGIKTIANEMGDNLNKSISDVGKAFDSGIKINSESVWVVNVELKI